jgi:hypothetical protein
MGGYRSMSAAHSGPILGGHKPPGWKVDREHGTIVVGSSDVNYN